MTNPYYTRTFAGMAILLGALGLGAVLSNSAARAARLRFQTIRESANAIAAQAAAQHQKSERLRRAIGNVREFTAAWTNCANVPEKDAADGIRVGLEAIAQRQLGLVTDNVITPQPERFSFGGSTMRVQRVTLRASGKDLAALLAWLGKVEEKYPAGVMEYCEFSSNVGGNTGLTLRIAEPVFDPSAQSGRATALAADLATLPDTIAAIAWPRYFPAVVKVAVAVGFQRNPLQPAVVADQSVVPHMHDDSDDLAPRLASALEGRVRSVIRGASPIVVIDGRVFRIGDELVIGKSRQKPVPDAKTKLKRIGEDRLVLQVSGGSPERPVQCDVNVELPAFLRAR